MEDESELRLHGVAVSVNDDPKVEYDSCPTESCRTNDGEVIVQEVKSTERNLVATKLSILNEELLDDKIRRSPQNVQIDIQSVVYILVGRVILGFLSKDGTGDTLNAHIAK